MSMNLNIKHFKTNIYSLFICLLCTMPIVDSISGAFHESYPIGQVYRLFFFAYIMILLIKVSGKSFLYVIIPFSVLLILQILTSVSGGYVVKSVQDTIKLFTPIMMIILFKVLFDRGKIHWDIFYNIFDLWSVLYPILIIIPSVSGLSSHAYDSSVGYKGFFYAINEVSFIMSCLVIYRFYALTKSINLKTIFLLGLNTICLILMGTKTGYASVAVGTVFFAISFFKERKVGKKIKIIGFVIASVICIFLFSDRIEVMTSGIFERWYYQRQLSYSTTDFLFSMRLRRIEEAFEIFFSGIYFPFGWGFGGELAGLPNVEMDFLDLLFRTGIVGFVFVVGFYFTAIRSFLFKNMWGTIIAIWSIALSFGAGHVLFYGQSGMMLALNMMVALVIYREKFY